MKCPICDFEHGVHAEVSLHVLVEHLKPVADVSYIRSCWCGKDFWFNAMLPEAGTFDLSRAGGYDLHCTMLGGIERHYHDCMMGVSK